MLMPKRTKYRKAHRGRMSGKSKGGTELNWGDFGLKALGCCWLTARQIEACRVAITRTAHRGGKLWIRVFPDKPVTKKPLETRQGKGKGAVDHYVAVVKPGRVLFEMAGVPFEVARQAMRLAAFKLPIPTRFVAREEEKDAG